MLCSYYCFCFVSRYRFRKNNWLAGCTFLANCRFCTLHLRMDQVRRGGGAPDHLRPRSRQAVRLSVRGACKVCSPQRRLAARPFGTEVRRQKTTSVRAKFTACGFFEVVAIHGFRHRLLRVGFPPSPVAAFSKQDTRLARVTVEHKNVRSFFLAVRSDVWRAGR